MFLGLKKLMETTEVFPEKKWTSWQHFECNLVGIHRYSDPQIKSYTHLNRCKCSTDKKESIDYRAGKGTLMSKFN